MASEPSNSNLSSGGAHGTTNQNLCKHMRPRIYVSATASILKLVVMIVTCDSLSMPRRGLRIRRYRSTAHHVH